MKKILLTALFMTIIPGLFALDLNDVKKYQMSSGGKIIFNTGFDGAEDAKLDSLLQVRGYRIEDSAGFNGTRGLVIERRPGDDYYPLGMIKLPNFEIGKPYEVKLRARRIGEIQRPLASTNIGVFCVEFQKSGKWVSGVYPGIIDLDEDWRDFNFTVQIPHPELTPHDSTSIALYLRQKVFGTIVLDDLEIREAGEDFAVILTSPHFLTVRGNSAEFRFQADKKAPACMYAWLALQNTGEKREVLIPVDGNRQFRHIFDNLKPGEAVITVKLADPERKRIVGGGTFHLQVRNSEPPPPPNAALIDEHNRLLVNGKPFLPIGVYTGENYEKHLRRIAEAGFNVILPYTMAAVNHRQLLDKERMSGDYGKDIRTFLDLAHRYNLRVIPALKNQLMCEDYYPAVERWDDAGTRNEVTAKIVRTFKDHPAILGWYVSDEAIRANIPYVVDLRRLISGIDPWHPTYTLTCHQENLPLYAVSGDVIGTDKYPIRHNRKEQSIRSMIPYLRGAYDSGVPHWVVPQIFNWAVHMTKTREELEKSYFPTAEEIRSMPLLAAIYGAKGFIFYMYDSATVRLDRRWPGRSEKEWPKIVQMVQMLRELEPFLLSAAPAPDVQVSGAPEEETVARAFASDSGELRVVIVSLGAPCKAVIHVDCGRELRSKFGKTRRIAPGKYEYRASAVDSDILY